MPPFENSRASVFSAFRESLNRNLRVAFPAQVTRFDASTQLVDVQPVIADWFPTDGDDVEQVHLPIIPNVPLLLQGGGGYRATFPVAVGDTVQILVNDRSLDAWLDQGGRQTPGDLRRHNLSDAVAIPGLHDNKHPWTGVPTDGATFGKDGGLQVKVTASDIELGGTDPPIARGDKVDANFQQVIAALAAAATASGTSPWAAAFTAAVDYLIPPAPPVGPTPASPLVATGSSVGKVKA